MPIIPFIWYDMILYDMIWYDMIWYDIFVNCSFSDTRWQQCNTHIKTHNIQNTTMIQDTRNGTYITIRIHKYTCTKCTTIKNRTESMWKNTINLIQISSKTRIIYLYIYIYIYIYILIMIDTLFLKIFTQLHYIRRHFISSHLNSIHYKSIHFATIPFGLTPFKISTPPLHLTSHHYTSPHVTSLHI